MNDVFVRKIYDAIVEDNISIYHKLFAEASTEDTIEYWKLARSLYQDIDDQQKEILFHIIRQVIIDTISNVFGTLDGICYLSEDDWEFNLTINGQNTDDDLQDTFLAYIEELIDSGELI
ncbi:MAG: hypothetical protein FWH40_08820 [Coriobacteriia bacterium]|nr:hypothetical protein [Coriobacteriia bacterium]